MFYEHWQIMADEFQTSSNVMFVWAGLPYITPTNGEPLTELQRSRSGSAKWIAINVHRVSQNGPAREENGDTNVGASERRREWS